MSIEIIVPSVGESVSEAVLAQWFKQDGDNVRKDDPVFLIETDKVTLEVVAESGGVLKILVQEGETVPIGAVVGMIETKGKEEPAVSEKLPDTEPKPAPPVDEPSVETKKPDVPEMPAPAPVPPPTGISIPDSGSDRPSLSPAVRRLVAEKSIDLGDITGTGPGERITKGDILLHLETAEAPQSTQQPKPVELPKHTDGDVGIIRKPMSPIRQRIASRLLEAKQSTAMLTTFNEIDMSQVKAFRAQYKEAFQKRYGVSLGMMSFFIKGVVTAPLPQRPRCDNTDDTPYPDRR